MMVKRVRSGRWWLRAAGLLAAVVVGIVVCALVAVGLVLTPERLTRLVSKYGSEYLVDGRVEVARVDLSVWSTFPNAVLTVDSLRVENLAVPAEYQTVVSCERIEGRLNLPALLAGRIAVGHALLARPRATLWFGSDSTRSSLSILPPSESDESSDPLSLPDLWLNRFVVVGDACLRYVSEPDSIDTSVIVNRTSLIGSDSVPEYQLSFSGLTQVPRRLLPVDSLRVGADGAIAWSPAAPMTVELKDFALIVDSIATQTSLKADFSDGVRIDRLKFKSLSMPLQRMAQLSGALPPMLTPARLSISAELLKPYVYDPDTLLFPSLHAEFRIADAPLSIPSYYLNLTNVSLNAGADISDAGLSESTVTLTRLNVRFPASDFNLSGKVANLADDPEINGCFRGKINFSSINPRLWTRLGIRLRGMLNADIDLNSRLSDLSTNGFHRARLKGDATLRDFVAIMPADSLAAGARTARLRFGTANGFRGIDSLLMASLTVDSAWTAMPGVRAAMQEMSVAFGVKNLDTLADTSAVTPMGGRLTIKALNYTDADSTRARARNVEGTLALRRYRGGSRSPHIDLSLTAKSLAMAGGPTLTALSGVEIAAEAFTTPRNKRPQTRADSMRRVARRDSMLLAATSDFEPLNVGIDRSTIALLRRWNLSGHIKARRGGLQTPMFPLRMRLHDLNLGFSPDSLNLRSLRLVAGRSDLNINGSITNIQRALGRRRSTSPLKMQLNLNADTINVNQLTRAAFQGAAWAAKADSTAMLTADLDSEQLTAPADTTEMMAIVVPMTIDAAVNVAARNIIYSNLDLNDFRGQILVANGTANLRDLHASSPLGSVDLNMLYYAPTRSDVSFGMGLDLRRFNIGRVTELIPALDTIMPILNTLGGIVDVGISATTPVDSMMNVKIPQLRALLELKGDSLRVLDEQTFKTMSKWLMFNNKQKNLIDHMDVRLTIDNNRLSLYPFVFDFDRYRIGVMGNNDLNLNLDYHVSVLRSPLPFKFGINIKGNADNMKIRLGRARLKEDMAANSTAIADTVRLNLSREIRNVFTRGANAARLAPLTITRPDTLPSPDESTDTLPSEAINQLILNN